jgi:transposase-like protein
MKYSAEFKQAAIRKYLRRGNKQVTEVLEEIGISAPTLYHWRDEFANVPGMKKSTKPQSRPANEKLKLLVEYDSLSEEKRGAFLRRNGVHAENLEEWRRQIHEALSAVKKGSPDRTELNAEKKKNQQLESELRRKDKALAEASALLILKKKADLIWGSGEEE